MPAQFDAEFGPDARNALTLRCAKVGGVSLLTEIQLALQPDIAELDDWEALFPNEKTPTQGNCPQAFTVDRVEVGEY